MSRRIVTIFGGSGFIGRHIVRRLAQKDFAVRIACRDTQKAGFLKSMGSPGQVVPVHCDVTDPAAVAAQVRDAEVAINLIGILYQRGARSFVEMHVNVAERIARAARDADIKTLLHMSALGADATAPAIYAVTKAQGEEKVRLAFPRAVIFRPGVVFGPEDNFLNQFALMARFSPVLPVLGATPVFRKIPPDLFGTGGPKFQPVYVGDVADAFVAAIDASKAAGRIYELGGPKVYSFKQILEYLLAETRRRALLAPLPLRIAAILATVLQIMPVPPLTPDQVKLLSNDNVLTGAEKGLADLGIQASALETVAPSYLKRHRTARKSGASRRLA